MFQTDVAGGYVHPESQLLHTVLFVASPSLRPTHKYFNASGSCVRRPVFAQDEEAKRPSRH